MRANILQKRSLGLIGTVAVLLMVLNATIAAAVPTELLSQQTQQNQQTMTVQATGGLAAFSAGDVFASVSNGRVQHYNSAGVLLETLNTGFGAYTTGMAFDSAGNLYVTNFNANKVAVFDNTGTFKGAFGSGYSADPESILFDGAGNAYVGQADGSADVMKFDSAGNLLRSFNVPTESRGSDWIDLAQDQCTLFYTSEGYKVKRFDVCNNVALTDFATLDHRPAFALRLLPDGGLLVADSTDIHRLDSSGNIIKTYDAAGENNWFALNLDPDGKSFWSGDFGTANFYKFDIDSGTQLMKINTGTGSSTLFGLAVYGERTAATGSISGTKFNDLNGNGQFDAGEPGLESWTITLTKADGSTVTTATNVNGDYAFGGLEAGTYTVGEVLQTGWKQTYPAGGTHTVALAAGQNVVDIDFLNKESIVVAPEFPSLILPIVGVLGMILLLYRRREN